MSLWNRGKEEKQQPSPAAPVPPSSDSAGRRIRLEPEAPAAPRTLPELLLSEGRVSREQLERALQKQQQTGEFIGEILIKDGALEQNSLISFIAKHCKVPHLSLLDYLIDESLIQLVPVNLCLKYRVLPIDRLGRNLTVAMVNPLDQDALDAVRQCCPDLRIKPILCAYEHFQTVISRIAQTSSKSGPVELGMTSFGLKRAPKSGPETESTLPIASHPVEKELEEVLPLPEPEEYSEAAAATVSPVSIDASALEQSSDEAAEEEIPEAIPVEDVLPEGEVNEGSVLRAVFLQAPPATPVATPPPASTPAPAEPDPMQDMAAVMLNSMRYTYSMLARRVDLFRGLGGEEVAALFARGATVEAAQDEVLFRKGDTADKMFVILGGNVEIEDDGRHLASLCPGDMFGEMALLSEEPRSAQARATASTSLLALDRQALQAELSRETSTQLLLNIIVTLSERLRMANEQMRTG